MNKKISDLEKSIHAISDELCKTISGQFDITLQISDPNEAIQKLLMMINFLLDTMRRKIKALNKSATEKDGLIAKLETSNHIDPLTGIYNRNYFHPYLKQQCINANRYNECFAIALCDIDNFKAINEQYSYTVGDAVIQQIASRIKDVLREVDTLARLDGNEFGLIIPQLKHAEDAGIIIERLLKAFIPPIKINGYSIKCHCSIGIATFPHSSKDLKGLLKNADLSLHDAKQSGGNNFIFFSKEIEQLHQKQQYIFERLKTSFEDTFTIHFQPTYAINDGPPKIVGCELLLRFKHEQPYEINIFDVICIAEQRGLMPTFGLSLLAYSLKKVKKIHQDYPNLHFGINLSVTQFDSSTLLAEVTKLVKSLELPTANIVFEVTESALVEDEGLMLTVLEQLREQGFKIAIDDFGKGYSSLTRLKNIPADILKIDMEFTQALTTDVQTQKIVKTIIDLSHSLNLEVICEGIETQTQLTFLTAYHCDSIQGYLLSRPLEIQDFKQLLEQSNQ